MQRELEVDLLRRVLDLHGRTTTSESDAVRRQRTEVYTDVARQRAEIDLLLRDQPLIAGLSCELGRPGSYLTAQVGVAPVMVVRQDDGGVRAFVNACRHRGSTVASGRGDATTFTCAYHGWTYQRDGALRGRPLARGAFDAVGCAGLIELPCDESCGVIVVGSGPGTVADAHELLGDYADEIDGHGLGGYRAVGERTTVWPFNWKLGFETFLESYHIFSLHRRTLGRQLKSAPMLSEFSGRHGRGVVMGNACPDLLDLPEAEWHRFQRATLVYWLFPNAVLSMPQSGHAELWTFLPSDGRPDRSEISVRFYAAPGAPAEQDFWDRLIEYTMSVVDAEDFGQQVLIQRNVGSGLVDEVVFGRNEPAMRHFHEQLDAVLGESGTTVS
ncbi:MAG: aromatic ring-hydroxylating dioxygenase subunit alpha [Ilumatobacteraceae bacterium]